MNADSARSAGRDGMGTQGRAADPGDVLAPDPAFAPRPEAGRVFTVSREIRSTDATSRGRLRLDALARYLQDVAEDDVADAGLRDPQFWLLRRATVSMATAASRTAAVQMFWEAAPRPSSSSPL